MATQTYEQLIAGANKIKENELPESNTHDIVGEQLLQMTNKMQEESSNNWKKFSELENSTDKFVFTNLSQVNSIIKELYLNENANAYNDKELFIDIIKFDKENKQNNRFRIIYYEGSTLIEICSAHFSNENIIPLTKEQTVFGYVNINWGSESFSLSLGKTCVVKKSCAYNLNCSAVLYTKLAIDGIDTQSLNEKVNTLRSDVTGLQSNITGLQNNVSELQKTSSLYNRKAYTDNYEANSFIQELYINSEGLALSDKDYIVDIIKTAENPLDNRFRIVYKDESGSHELLSAHFTKDKYVALKGMDSKYYGYVVINWDATGYKTIQPNAKVDKNLCSIDFNPYIYSRTLDDKITNNSEAIQKNSEDIQRNTEAIESIINVKQLTEQYQEMIDGDMAVKSTYPFCSITDRDLFNGRYDFMGITLTSSFIKPSEIGGQVDISLSDTSYIDLSIEQQKFLAIGTLQQFDTYEVLSKSGNTCTCKLISDGYSSIYQLGSEIPMKIDINYEKQVFSEPTGVYLLQDVENVKNNILPWSAMQPDVDNSKIHFYAESNIILGNVIVDMLYQCGWDGIKPIFTYGDSRTYLTGVLRNEASGITPKTYSQIIQDLTGVTVTNKGINGQILQTIIQRFLSDWDSEIINNDNFFIFYIGTNNLYRFTNTGLGAPATTHNYATHLLYWLRKATEKLKGNYIIITGCPSVKLSKYK